MAKSGIGIWLIGARGGVATTTIVGLNSLKKGTTEPVGLVSELPRFSRLPLTDWNDFVVGGHEIRSVTLLEAASLLVEKNGALPRDLVLQCKEDLAQIDRRICPGALNQVGSTISNLATLAIASDESPRQTIERIKSDLKHFIDTHHLAHVIVVNVASTEPSVDIAAFPSDWENLKKQLDQPDCLLPASSLYAISAFQSGCSYINFTPSLGSAPEAIHQLAVSCNACHMGCDGKTGETLLKSTLAPMFALRNLQMMSWVGHNIFGNMDGQVLNDPANKKTKVTSKDKLLGQIFGYQPQTLVSIEYIESLGDWKTAWDHMHFKGFLETPMTMQFTWQGCDSLLAAPLVLDLVRFTELAWRRGNIGRLKFLASFFKSPYGVQEQGFVKQYQMLEAWTDS